MISNYKYGILFVNNESSWSNMDSMYNFDFNGQCSLEDDILHNLNLNFYKNTCSLNTYPIGYQPFERCSLQHGYGIYMLYQTPLQKHVRYRRYRFKHSRKLSDKVYELMEGGNKIYDHKSMYLSKDIVNVIDTSSIFSKKALSIAIGRNSFFNNIPEKQIKEMLKEFYIFDKENIIKKPINIVNDNILDEAYVRLIDDQNKDYDIEKHYGIKLGWRVVYRQIII